MGDHGCSEQIVPCGERLYCREGLYWLCEPHDIYGFHQATPSSWAEDMVFPRRALNDRLPDGMDPEHGVFVEPLGCAVHTINRADLRFIETVVIAGCGSLGLDMIRKRGRLIEVSVLREPVTADRSIIGDTRGLDIEGVHLSPFAERTATRMIAEGRLPMSEIITHRLPLEHFEEGIRMVIDGSASLKVTLRS